LPKPGFDMRQRFSKRLIAVNASAFAPMPFEFIQPS
jgi:hypothetical protein